MVLADEWLPEAREDLTSELEYVYSEFGAKAAEEVYLKLLDCMDNLRRYPHLGKHFADMFCHGHEVRALSLRQTSIIYCICEESLLVIAVWNNRRDDTKINSMIQSRQDL